MSIDFLNVTKTLTKPRVRTLVFDGMTASVPDDRSVGVLARPAEGKTTLLYLANGSLNPDKGRITRRTVMSYPVGSARVFSAKLTVRENLVFVCRLFGFDPKPIIRFVADFTEIGKAMDRQFNLLGREDKTKVSFTASYAIPFDTYLVDQNLTGGRGDFREACEELLAERRKTAGFVICSSSPRVIRQYCDTFFVIDDHTLVPVASVDEAIARLDAASLRDDDGFPESAGDDVGD